MKIDKKLIKELVDNLKEFNLTELEYQEGQTKIKVSKAPILGSLVNSNNFRNRDKYSMKNLVIADFSSATNNFKLNKLYTTVMIGVAFASFIFITYGLSSSITPIS